MKRLILVSLLCTRISSATESFDARAAEGRIKTDLQESLSRMISVADFSVQAFADTSPVTERRLVEGETVVQSVPSPAIVPPLPGFEVDEAEANSTPPAQSRQVFRTVESQILKSVRVSLTLNQNLSTEITTAARQLAESYVNTTYPGKGAVTMTLIPMLASKGPKPASDENGETTLSAKETPRQYLSQVGLISGALLLFILLSTWLGHRRSSNRPAAGANIADFRSARWIRPVTVDEALALPPTSGETTAEEASSAKARPIGSGVSLPPTPKSSVGASSIEMAPGRAKLVELIIENAPVFRRYFERLPETSRQELYASVRGPAVESLFDHLGLPKPGAELGATRTTEVLAFHESSFREFLEADRWQRNQVFGFLRDLGDERLQALLERQEPLHAALTLKTLGAESSAKLLERLPGDHRGRVLMQFVRLTSLTPAEIESIEKTARRHAEELRQVPETLLRSEWNYWEELVDQVADPMEILRTLEHSRTDLHAWLMKRRFKLEDLATLPREQAQRAVGAVDNDLLSRALVGSPPEVVRIVFEQLSEGRRSLIEGQITAHSGISSEELRIARQALIHRIREVLS